MLKLLNTFSFSPLKTTYDNSVFLCPAEERRVQVMCKYIAVLWSRVVSQLNVTEIVGCCCRSVMIPTVIKDHPPTYWRIEEAAPGIAWESVGIRSPWCNQIHHFALLPLNLQSIINIVILYIIIYYNIISTVQFGKYEFWNGNKSIFQSGVKS